MTFQMLLGLPSAPVSTASGKGWWEMWFSDIWSTTSWWPIPAVKCLHMCRAVTVLTSLSPTLLYQDAFRKTAMKVVRT